MKKITILGKEFEEGDMVEVKYKVHDFVKVEMIGYIHRLDTADNVKYLELAMRHTTDPRDLDYDLSQSYYNAKKDVAVRLITSINKLVYEPN